MTQRAFQPNWAVPPGEILAEMLSDRKWTQTELAKRWHLSTTYVCDLVASKRGFTARVALRLEAVFGSPSAEFWMNLQRDHELHAVRQEMAKELERIKEWQFQ